MPSINPEYNNYNVRENDSQQTKKNMPQHEERDDMSIFYEYDDEGHETTRYIDSDKDGKVDVTTTLDASGRITEDLIDEDHDGDADLHVSYEYDEQGHEIARYIDFDLDGKVDVVTHLNEKGEIVSDDFDENGDGEIDFHVDYNYDEEGNEERLIDTNFDGQADTIATANAAGEIIAEDKDTDGNGTLDTHIEYGKDDKGNEIVTNQTGMQPVNVEDLPEGHTIKDGKIRDANGNVIGRVISTEKDADGDGVADTVDSYYLYTNQEEPATQEEEPTQTEHAVARADLPEGYKIENGKIYDAEGKEIGRTEVSVKDVTGDGKTDTITRYFLYGAEEKENTITTADGRTAKSVNKEDLPQGYTIKDGVIYDAENNVIGLTQISEADADGDGIPDTIESYFLYT